MKPQLYHILSCCSESRILRIEDTSSVHLLCAHKFSISNTSSIFQELHFFYVCGYHRFSSTSSIFVVTSSLSQRISGNNRALQLSQNIKPANSAKSTAGILDEMLNAPPPTRAESENIAGIEVEEEPIYIRHKDGTWDPDAEMNYNALKRCHSDEVEKNGIDDLTVQEAYTDVLKTRPGYIKGLGPGSQLPKKNRVQEMQQAAVERETELNGVIAELRMSNYELQAKMSQMHQEALEREKKLKEEALEREKKLKEEALEREKKFQDEALEREKKLQEAALERDNRLREEFIQLMYIYSKPA